jgi:aldose 1-epimerase
MHFSIRHVQENGLSLVNLADERSGTEVSILPGYGATLHAFRVRSPSADLMATPDALFNVIDNYAGLAEVEEQMGKSFKGPKLSPFPCRIAKAAYRFAGKEYIFSRSFGDGTAIHGLLYDKPFSITDEAANESSASLTLQYEYKRQDAGYPFQYNCLVKYILHPENLLEVRTMVTNLDDSAIPIADGWHPYFHLGGKIDDWLLRFNAESIVEFDDQLIPSGRLLTFDDFNKERPIGHTQLDNCFVLAPGEPGPVCSLFNPGSGLRISFFPDAGYPYLQIFTPPGRQSVAIENLSAAPNCFNNNMGLTLLSPGHSQTFTVKYKVGVV